ncbi:N-formylglutamate amidohydrolase [Actinomycetota bacterium]
MAEQTHTFIGPWDGPVVSTAIHTGHDLRPSLHPLMALPEPDRFREEDPFTDEIANAVASRVVVHRSRFEVDLNRGRDEAVYRAPEDCWGLDVWHEPPLATDEVEQSLAEHDAFYAALADRLDPIAERGRFVLFDVHSYNHRRDGVGADPAPGQDNPEVNVGTGSLDRDAWGDIVDLFIDTLSAAPTSRGPLDVRENVRFQGANLARWTHDRYPGVGCALALEFKKTFMDEWTGEPDRARIDELAAALASTVAPLTRALRQDV